MKLDIALVEYGAGNLHSVAGALERAAEERALPCQVRVTSDPQELLQAHGVVFPGVGSFRTAMHRLRDSGLDGALSDYVHADRPFFAVCLGMQVLFEQGVEGGECSGLGLLKGIVTELPAHLKKPHLGWNRVVPRRADLWLAPQGIPFYAYFAHSFAVSAEAPATVAECRIDDVVFAAAIRKGNLLGTQFHPERSGRVGLQLLGRFLEEVRRWKGAGTARA